LVASRTKAPFHWQVYLWFWEHPKIRAYYDRYDELLGNDPDVISEFEQFRGLNQTMLEMTNAPSWVRNAESKISAVGRSMRTQDAELDRLLFFAEKTGSLLHPENFGMELEIRPWTAINEPEQG
jgi:hypothetical protein